MTDPTPLSPAAQAVLDAYGHYSESWCGTSCILDYELRGVAAALRAAADHLKTMAPWVGHLETPGIDWSFMELESIAAELEGGNG